MRFVGRTRSFQIILLRTLFASFYARSCGVTRRERLGTFEGKSDKSLFKNPPKICHNLGAYSRTTEGYFTRTKHLTYKRDDRKKRPI